MAALSLYILIMECRSRDLIMEKSMDGVCGLKKAVKSRLKLLLTGNKRARHKLSNLDF